MTFVDSECSDTIFREGIPAVQWDGEIPKHRSFDMGGFGGLANLTTDEWICLLYLVMEALGQFEVTS